MNQNIGIDAPTRGCPPVVARVSDAEIQARIHGGRVLTSTTAAGHPSAAIAQMDELAHQRMLAGARCTIEIESKRLGLLSTYLRGPTIMPKLSAVTSDKLRLTIALGEDQELKVTYRPSLLTPAMLQQIQAAERDNSISGGLLEPLSALLVSWDLTDDDEDPIPTTPAALADVPFVILRRVLEEIAAAMAAASRSGRPSGV